MEHTDVCFAPVLTMAEAAEHPHNVARDMFIERRRRQAAGAGAALQPHAGAIAAPAGARRAHTDEVLADWGIPPTASTPSAPRAPWPPPRPDP